MSKGVPLGEIRDVMNKLLTDYATETKDKVATMTKQIADDCAKKLRKENNHGRWKRYPTGWTVKKMASKGVGATIYVVWNSKYYRIAHLLEDGYYPRGGTKFHKGTKHIKPVEEWANTEFPKRLTKELGGK